MNSANSKTNRIPVQPIPLETVEVAIHKTYEQYRTPQTSTHASSVSGGGYLHDKPAELGFSYDVERGAKNGI